MDFSTPPVTEPQKTGVSSASETEKSFSNDSLSNDSLSNDSLFNDSLFNDSQPIHQVDASSSEPVNGAVPEGSQKSQGGDASGFAVPPTAGGTAPEEQPENESFTAAAGSLPQEAARSDVEEPTGKDSVNDPSGSQLEFDADKEQPRGAQNPVVDAQEPSSPTDSTHTGTSSSVSMVTLKEVEMVAPMTMKQRQEAANARRAIALEGRVEEQEMVKDSEKDHGSSVGYAQLPRYSDGTDAPYKKKVPRAQTHIPRWFAKEGYYTARRQGFVRGNQKMKYGKPGRERKTAHDGESSHDPDNLPAQAPVDHSTTQVDGGLTPAVNPWYVPPRPLPSPPPNHGLGDYFIPEGYAPALGPPQHALGPPLHGGSVMIPAPIPQPLLNNGNANNKRPGACADCHSHKKRCTHKEGQAATVKPVRKTAPGKLKAPAKPKVPAKAKATAPVEPIQPVRQEQQDPSRAPLPDQPAMPSSVRRVWDCDLEPLDTAELLDRARILREYINDLDIYHDKIGVAMEKNKKNGHEKNEHETKLRKNAAAKMKGQEKKFKKIQEELEKRGSKVDE